MAPTPWNQGVGAILVVCASHFTYHGWDRKEVEVLVDDEWRPGELRSWDQADDGTWSGIVSWSAGVMSTHLDRFPADRIRPA